MAAAVEHQQYCSPIGPAFRSIAFSSDWSSEESDTASPEVLIGLGWPEACLWSTFDAEAKSPILFRVNLRRRRNLTCQLLLPEARILELTYSS